MNLSNTTLPPALAATLLVTAAALTAALAPPIWLARQDAPAPLLLACELAPTPAPAGTSLATSLVTSLVTSLAVTNRSSLLLPAGSAVRWASLGTPTPAGGTQSLAQDLAPGDSVALAAGAMLHASGCLASAVPAR